MNPSKSEMSMSEDNKGTTYSFDVCSQCKSICCQDAKPPLTENRKQLIQEYIKKNKIRLKEPFAQGDYCYPSVDSDIYCRLFNKKTGKCMVHPVKPETCVAGPITFDINFNAQKVGFFHKKSEICAYAGVLFKDKPALQEHFEAARKQIIELINQLSADELRALMKIDEPQTFKFCEEPLSPEVIRKLDL
jgi:Fe-S-cluster containining protein